MCYLLRSYLMRNLKGKFNISLARIDYFHLRQCWYSNNKNIEEECIAFAFREFWKQPNTNIHKHVFKICFETFYGGAFYLCRKFTVRLPKWYNSISFKRNGIRLTFPKLCNVGCMWAVFHYNNRNLILSKWLISILHPSFSFWSH